MNSRFDLSIIEADPKRRSHILPVLDAALNAVDPAESVRQTIRFEGERLIVGLSDYELDAIDRVTVIGFGKAATPMAEAVLEILGNRVAVGAIVTKYGHGPANATDLAPIQVFEAGHPLPDDAGVQAAKYIVDLVEQTKEDDLVLCLISGGGSALLTLPVQGITMADIQATTDALLRSGATIHEINALRKHLSQVKGGQLARIIAPASCVSLIVSDVVGSSLDVIASGPTSPDSATWQSAWAIVERYELTQRLPEAVQRHLGKGLAGELADTPGPDDPVFDRVQNIIIADNAIAAAAAQQQAQAQGFHSAILTTFMEGEAKEAAIFVIGLGREIVAHVRPLARPACLIFGGETTVTLHSTGKGGRNQELALAAALVLQDLPEGEVMVVVSLASDGTDGPTDAAGGIADFETVNRGLTQNLIAFDFLRENNSYPYLRAVGDLLMTGPTQTNVNDLVFVFVF